MSRGASHDKRNLARSARETETRHPLRVRMRCLHSLTTRLRSLTDLRCQLTRSAREFAHDTPPPPGFKTRLLGDHLVAFPDVVRHHSSSFCFKIRCALRKML